MIQIVFATNNLNKLKEVQSMLPANINILGLNDIGCNEDIPETQPTIEGNAIQKAQFIKDHYGHDCFADDTGLEVEALNNEPGVYSARYAGEQRNNDDNINLLLKNLENQTNRQAQFKTVIALHFNNQLHTFKGICKGYITLEKHGDQGFGYDPVFKPLEADQTFAEMSLQEKNNIGHRGKAFKQLVDFLSKLDV